MDSLLGNGTSAPQNSSMVTVANVNGTQKAYINGTLPNGTTASGGTDPSNPSEVSGAAKMVVNYGGYWVMLALVGATVSLL